MILELLINDVDFTDCLITKGSRPLKPDEKDWVGTQRCYGEDIFECSLDFGHRSPDHAFPIPPEPVQTSSSCIARKRRAKCN